MARSFRSLLHPNQPTVPCRKAPILMLTNYCKAYSHIPLGLLQPTYWTRTSVMTACWVHESLSLTLDSALSPRPTGTKQQGASGQSVATRQSVPVWPLGDNWWGVTGLPSQHLSADWQSGRRHGCTVLPHPAICVWRLLLILCPIYEEMIGVQHDIITVALFQWIPPV